jgi:hypothetical protein
LANIIQNPKHNQIEQVQTIQVKWFLEEYEFRHNFSLENIGAYINRTIRNNVELIKPNILYKFYSNSDYNLEALSKNYLYFSNPRNFNDPFDCLTNREKYILRGGEGIVNHREELGVCSFSVINDNPLMWGHYTNNYKGFCLKFDNQSLLKNDNIQIKSHIAYLKNYQPTNKNYDKAISELKKLSQLDEQGKKLYEIVLGILYNYCWKYYDWQYEQEFRAISWTTNNFNRTLNFKESELKEIYIGHRMKIEEPEFYEKLMNILDSKYENTKRFEVKPNPLVVKIEFEEL